MGVGWGLYVLLCEAVVRDGSGMFGGSVRACLLGQGWSRWVHAAACLAGVRLGVFLYGGQVGNGQIATMQRLGYVGVMGDMVAL